MYNYHTESAHDIRARDRQENAIVPVPLHVYYHAAVGRPHWDRIVREQFRLAKFCELPTMKVVVLGSPQDITLLSEIADRVGLAINIVYTSGNLHEYEHPTLQRLWEHALREPMAAYLYWHTKGASNPMDESKIGWRRVMQRHVIYPWRENHACLAVYDMVGANWQNSHLAHFHGNFWLARGDWLSNLQSPEKYRAGHQEIVIWDNPWDRMHCEFWLGSEPWHDKLSRVCEDHQWGRGKGGADYIDTQIEGFDYDV